MTQDLFFEKLNWFKQNEKPELVLLMADDQLLIKIIIAWANLTLTRINSLTDISNTTDNETWELLWENTRYSMAELKMKAGISLSENAIKTRINYLISNRIIYPDGTVNSFVQRYLKEKVLSLFTSRKNNTSRRSI